jgi:hypothetical protein
LFLQSKYTEESIDLDLIALNTEQANVIGKDSIDILVANSIIHNPYDTSRTGLAIIPFYASHKQPYEGCRKEKFGSDGEYTDLICDLVEQASDICRLEEKCDFKQWSAIRVHAMKGDVFKQTELAAKIVCDESFPDYTIDTCPQEIVEAIIPEILGLQQLIEFGLPGGFNNPLLTRVSIIPTEGNKTEVDGGPYRSIGIGDGIIEAMRDIHGDEFMPIYFKTLCFSILGGFIKDYHNPFPLIGEAIEDYFEMYITEGYLFQKYKHMFFTEEELSSIIPSYRGSGYKNCAYHFGAYYAWKCETLEEVMDIQSSIALPLNMAGSYGCAELIGYTSMLKTGKKAVDSQTTGSRCTNACTDSAERFKIEGKGKGTCEWVFRSNADENGFPKRCALNGVAGNCPDTCGDCCVDAQDKFYIPDVTAKNKKDRKKRKCAWAGKKKTEERCAMNGVAGNCPETCGVVGCSV